MRSFFSKAIINKKKNLSEKKKKKNLSEVSLHLIFKWKVLGLYHKILFITVEFYILKILKNYRIWTDSAVCEYKK